jgi:hypothetical protein
MQVLPKIKMKLYSFHFHVNHAYESTERSPMEDKDDGVRGFPWLLTAVVPFHLTVPVNQSRDFVGSEDRLLLSLFK